MAEALIAQLLVGSPPCWTSGRSGGAAGHGHLTGRHDGGRLRALEQRGMRAAFLDAVMAATERSRELGARDRCRRSEEMLRGSGRDAFLTSALA